MTQDHFEDMTNLDDFFHTSRLPLVSVIKPRLTKKSTANVTKHEKQIQTAPFNPKYKRQ